jgi:hypothetical protein
MAGADWEPVEPRLWKKVLTAYLLMSGTCRPTAQSSLGAVVGIDPTGITRKRQISGVSGHERGSNQASVGGRHFADGAATRRKAERTPARIATDIVTGSVALNP